MNCAKNNMPYRYSFTRERYRDAFVFAIYVCVLHRLTSASPDLNYVCGSIFNYFVCHHWSYCPIPVIWLYFNKLTFCYITFYSGISWFMRRGILKNRLQNSNKHVWYKKADLMFTFEYWAKQKRERMEFQLVENVIAHSLTNQKYHYHMN